MVGVVTAAGTSDTSSPHCGNDVKLCKHVQTSARQENNDARNAAEEGTLEFVFRVFVMAHSLYVSRCILYLLSLDCSSLKKKEVRQAAAKEVVVVRMTGILVHG
jgi:hypothetical protein